MTRRSRNNSGTRRGLPLAYPPSVHGQDKDSRQTDRQDDNTRHASHAHAAKTDARAHPPSRDPRTSPLTSRRNTARHRAASVPALTRNPDRVLPAQAQLSIESVQEKSLDVADATDATDAVALESRELWLACYLPDMAYDAIARLTPNPAFESTPVVVHDGDHRQPIILGTNDRALEHGITRGMRLGVAHTLVSGLHAILADDQAQVQAIESLATCALEFSSRVVVEPPQTLLLEVGGSLRLFGELRGLVEEFRAASESLGFRTNIALAPTASAAQLLCQHSDGVVVTDRAQLRSAIAALPVSALDLTERTKRSLNGMGLTLVEDLLRMPRDGLARRTGIDLINQLDQLTGHRADPRHHFRPRERFSSNLFFTDELEDCDQLLIVAEQLLCKLEVELFRHASGVNQLHWVFEHNGEPATNMTLNVSKPERLAERFLPLMKTRFESLELKGSVHTVHLTTSCFEQLQFTDAQLFAEISFVMSPHFDLVDRLKARLGDDRITSVNTVSDHRPETAWHSELPSVARSTRKDKHKLPVTPGRPLWLLGTPRKLNVRHSIPWLNGPMEILSGPERIETGWWEKSSIRRDYYVGRTTDGRRLWVFNDIRTREWFIHGFFV